MSDIAIRVHNVSKCYQVYENPRNRLKQFIFPRLASILRWAPKKYFSEFWALKDVSFEIKKGETVGIIGRNGSGKSTVLQLICGTLYPTMGSVEVSGRIAALLELGSGFNPEFTGRENVYINASVLGLSKHKIDTVYDSIVAFADIGEFINQPIKSYSSGMVVRLAFAVSIHVEPDILIIDEALAVGDARFQSKCLNKIKALQDSGVTTLFVSHDMTSVRNLCNYVVWLDSGRLISEGSVPEITANYLKEVFSDTHQNNAKESASSLLSNEANKPGIVNPIARWGSHVGSIKSVLILNELGVGTNVLGQSSFSVEVCFEVPNSIDKHDMHVAISIKNTAGTDIIVRSTFDEPKLSLSSLSGECELVFKLENILNNGDYMVAVALENRDQLTISYYEYIEGAYYFSSIADVNRYGLIVPDVLCELKPKT